MLEALCGSKSVQRLLLFLFVNQTAYATQVSRTLNCALTPIQKALDRLEKGDILTSYYQGKTKVFAFNPAYPLLAELEELLKKAFTLLAPHEKKAFAFIRAPKLAQSSHILFQVWSQLKKVRYLTFRASSNGSMNHGKAHVEVSSQHENCLHFHEKGMWQNDIGFSNIYRWTLDRDAKVISLEHLRYGQDQPVFLFHLAPSTDQTLSSIDAHLCKDDAYFGQVSSTSESLRLSFRVIGPKKNEEIETYYTF